MIKDINTLIGKVFGLERFIWLITIVMIISFCAGFILGLNKANS